MKTADLEYQCPSCSSVVPAGTKVCPSCGTKINETAGSAPEMSTADREAIQNLTTIVLKELKKGTDNVSIAQKLVEKGLEQTVAAQFVTDIQIQASRIAEQERITVESYTPAFIGAGLAAIVGGILWGLIVIFSNYEMGIMAWGMGLLAGYAVVKFSRGKKGVPFQLIAVLSSLVGIIIGKYITFYHFLQQAIAADSGGNVPSGWSIFSENVFRIFINEFGTLLSGHDALWVIFAVITAWSIPRGIGLRNRI